MEEIESWDLIKALCISDDGTTIAGYGKSPNNEWTGWVIKIILEDNIGDINEDGEVDISDVLLLVTYLLGGELTPSQLVNADMDYNLDINIFDLLAILDISTF